jgi:GNAT superfamily N-acetyltransferase
VRTRRRPRRTGLTPNWSDVGVSTPIDVAEVFSLLDAAHDADGVRPLSEEAELRLRHGGPSGGQDVVLRDGDALVGYARYDIDGDDASAELVVHPAFRRRGFGGALLDRVVELAGERVLHVWAHGDLPGSTELLSSRGFSRSRVLLQMRRDLAGVEADPRPELPDGVRIVPFRPGRDEDAWLRVNDRPRAGTPAGARPGRGAPLRRGGERGRGTALREPGFPPVRGRRAVAARLPSLTTRARPGRRPAARSPDGRTASPAP